jgi:hypothetical protein
MSGREPDVLGRVGRPTAILEGSVLVAPHEADAPWVTALAVTQGAGAAQCVWIAQPNREIVEILI